MVRDTEPPRVYSYGIVVKCTSSEDNCTMVRITGFAEQSTWRGGATVTRSVDAAPVSRASRPLVYIGTIGPFQSDTTPSRSFERYTISRRANNSVRVTMRETSTNASHVWSRNRPSSWWTPEHGRTQSNREREREDIDCERNVKQGHACPTRAYVYYVYV